MVCWFWYGELHCCSTVEEAVVFLNWAFYISQKELINRRFIIFNLLGQLRMGLQKKNGWITSVLLEIAALHCILTQEQLNGWIWEIKGKQQLCNCNCWHNIMQMLAKYHVHGEKWVSPDTIWPFVTPWKPLECIQYSKHSTVPAD